MTTFLVVFTMSTLVLVLSKWMRSLEGQHKYDASQKVSGAVMTVMYAAIIVPMIGLAALAA